MGSSSFLIKAGAILLFLLMVPVRFAMKWHRDPEERRLMVLLLRDKQAWRWGVATAIVLSVFNLATGSWFTGIMSGLIVGLCVQLVLAWRHQKTYA